MNTASGSIAGNDGTEIPQAKKSITPLESGQKPFEGAPIKAEGSVEDTQVASVDIAIESDDAGPPEVWISLKFSWAGKTFDFQIAESDRVYDLKSFIFSLTNVPPERQKVLGLVKGKLPPEEDTISSLKLSTGKKFSLIGTPLGDELKDPAQVEELPDVFNDRDIDFSENSKASEAYIADKRNQRKIRQITSKLRKDLTIMHPLREGKKLLVLDIDYTIVDTKALVDGSLTPPECARPSLHKFLETVYPHYDICIWSQTSWIWLEAKLHELGMIGNDSNNYKINFVLDKTVMFKVFSVKDGKPFDHSVKPLKIIWNMFPQYNASNTIHVDDLSRNFALNPGEGLKIKAFKEAKSEKSLLDHELDDLRRYMVHIAPVEDFKSVDHKDWKSVARGLRPQPR